ncbi:glycosyltransferase [Undibacterium arcticum]
MFWSAVDRKKKALLRRAQAEQLSNVWFLDPVSKEQIPALLQRFDVAYLGMQRQPLFRFGIAPNKLMDYMMAGRPVLMAIESGNDPVREANCGLTIQPEDPQAMVDGIRTLLTLSEKKSGERWRNVAGHSCCRTILTQFWANNFFNRLRRLIRMSIGAMYASAIPSHDTCRSQHRSGSGW